MAQATCYRNADFGCDGAPTTLRTSEQCCDQGFLSFKTSGSDACQLCLGKIYVYYRIAECIAVFIPQSQISPIYITYYTKFNVIYYVVN